MADRSQLHSSLSIFVFLLLIIHGHSLGFGVSPQNFFKSLILSSVNCLLDSLYITLWFPEINVTDQGEFMEVKASKLASTKTSVANTYYSVPYCHAYKIVETAQSLGDFLGGIQNTPYKFQMRASTRCNIVCCITLNEKTAKEFKEKIDDEYRVNMILDDLPLVTKTDHDSPHLNQLGYFVGHKVRFGNTTNEKYYINNHLSFIVRFHQNLETSSARVVGFEVKAFSINHEYDHRWSYQSLLSTCDPHAKRLVTGFDPPQEVDDQEEVIFTYDVEFLESNVQWASRWDTYLLTADDQIHWFSIVNSLMIVLSISGMVAMIILRTLHRDIFEYDQLDNLEDAQEQTGWKLVHMDVFRPPVNSKSLSVLVGTGVQLFGTILITIIFMVSGILSPSNLLNELIFVTVVVWALMGIFGGLAMARLLYKTFEESEWNIKASLTTAFMFPGTVFCILFVLYSLTSSGGRAVLFDSMFGLLFLWLAISAPLVFMGSYICFIGPEMKESVKTSKIPREIPEQSWYMSPFFTIMVGGIIPFVVVFELFSMLTSIGLHHFYYMFGLVFVILIVTCAEVTIVLCYFQLCREDYQWWWRSYLTAGSSAFYVFMYAIFYFFTKPNFTELVPGAFYFGYMLIASFALFMLTGTIGFYACLWFIRRIYSSLAIV